MTKARFLKHSASALLLAMGVWSVNPGTLFAQDAAAYPNGKPPESAAKPVLSSESSRNFQQPLVINAPDSKSSGINENQYEIKFDEGGDVLVSPVDEKKKRGLQILETIDQQLKELTDLEKELNQSLGAKENLEKDLQKENEILEGQMTGVLWSDAAGRSEEMAFFRQVMMTLDLIADDLRGSLALGDSSLITAAAGRFTGYRDTGDPALAKEQLEAMIREGNARRVQLPQLIKEARDAIFARTEERHDEVQKALKEYSGLIKVVSEGKPRADFTENVWARYKSYGDVLLPWKRLIWVEYENYLVTIAGLDLDLEFQNGEMDPGILGSLKALQAAKAEYPEREIRLVHPPEVLSQFGGYSVVRSGFAHFLSVSKNAQTLGYLLFETEYPGSAESRPVKTAVVPLEVLTRAQLSSADVNRDGEVNDLDADLMIHATVTKGLAEGSLGQAADLNGDGFINREDALMTLALGRSRSDVVEREALLGYIQKAETAQADFLRGLPGVWADVQTLEPVSTREELEAALKKTPQDQGAYLLHLWDYFLLMQSAAKAIQTLRPELISEMHPDFFDEEGNLKPELVQVIEEAGLAALPRVAIYEKMDTRMPIEDLRQTVLDMKALLGEDPEAAYTRALAESRFAKDSVIESLEAVNAALAEGLNDSLSDERKPEAV